MMAFCLIGRKFEVDNFGNLYEHSYFQPVPLKIGIGTSCAKAPDKRISVVISQPVNKRHIGILYG
jgi:hypothetical protein